MRIGAWFQRAKTGGAYVAGWDTPLSATGWRTLTLTRYTQWPLPSRKTIEQAT